MNIANALTVSRVVLSPLILILFQVVGDEPMSSKIIALLIGLFVFSEISDILDGHLSRKYNTVSDFGKLADPFADSVYHLTIFFCFVQQGWIPLWMPMVLLYRDLTVSALRMYSLNKNIVVGARASGKIKAIVQGTCSILMMAILLKHNGDAVAVADGLYNLALIAVLTTLWSAVDYTFGILKGTK